MLTENKNTAPFQVIKRIAALCLLLVAGLGSAQGAHAQSNVAGFVVNTFVPSVVNTGRCGAENVYTSSSALSRSRFSPPYTGAIRWVRLGYTPTNNYQVVRVDYVGFAAKKVKQGGSWTVIWSAEVVGVSCSVRRIQPA